MPEIEINGGQVVYEFVGPGNGEVVVLTPGGRFSKDFPGVRPLAEALAAGGKRVLLWDRPNCGSSDIQLYGKTESHMRAETMGLMLKELGLGPVVIAGGSGGARDSMLIAIMYPELVRKLALWSIVGGAYSTINLAAVYVLSELRTIRTRGLEGVMELPGWSDLIKANPRNRDRLLAVGHEEFQRVMLRWFDAYVPKAGQTVPGVHDWEIETIDVPTLIIRGGVNDADHPKRTSMEVHCLIEGSRLVEPPWPEDAWERAVEASMVGKGSIFDPWVQAAPVLLDFINEA